MSEQIKFGLGDSVKFQVLGTVPETGHHMLPPLRERTYMGVTIVEKNGEAIPPTSMEVGFYNDQWNHGERPAVDKYWTSKLDSGMPRARAEDAGKIMTLVTAPFLDLSTLKITDENVPPSAPAAEVVSKKPTETKPASRDNGWFTRTRSRLFGNSTPTA